MKKRLFVAKVSAIALFTSILCSTFAQEMLQPVRLIDSHTAGVLPRASYDFECRIYPAGDPKYGAGLNMGIEVGVTNRLMIGISYGGEGIVGRGNVANFNYFPGLLIKYRLFEENFFFPAISFGYDHQGFGGNADTNQFDYRGYIYKSPGFFVAISKNYLLFTKIQFGIHGAVNYSMEEIKNVKWPNGFAGIDLGLNDELSLVMEYNLGLNTRDPKPNKTALYARPFEGYLNLGLRWALSRNFLIEFDAKDVFENRKQKNSSTVGWTRELKIVYFSEF